MTITGARVLGDRYQLGDLVGSGGMADVYRATDQLLDRDVAVKVLRSSSSQGGEERARFTTEARTLAALNHPGLVTLLDAGILDEHPYLVMELVEGPCLSRAIKETGPLDPVLVASLGGQVAEALAYAHQKGVVHRDVKPGNIMIAADRRALLTDFGIARLLSETSHHTRTGDTIGSPAYLSPEQVNGEPFTEAVDIYSLGLVLLEALTGKRAYPGTPVEAAVARLSAAPAIPTSINPAWRDLLLQMTRREPAERPTALEVAATLTSAFRVELSAAPVVELDADTGAFDLSAATGSVETPDAARTAVGLPPTPAQRRWAGTAWLVSAALLIGLLIVFVAVGGLRPDVGTERPNREIPAGVPDQMREPLKNLHDAVDGAQR